jgi:hypothetical protein
MQPSARKFSLDQPIQGESDVLNTAGEAASQLPVSAETAQINWRRLAVRRRQGISNFAWAGFGFHAKPVGERAIGRRSGKSGISHAIPGRYLERELLR